MRRRPTEDEILQAVDDDLRKRFPVEHAAGKVGLVRDASGHVTHIKGVGLNVKGKHYLAIGKAHEELDRQAAERLRKQGGKLDDL